MPTAHRRPRRSMEQSSRERGFHWHHAPKLRAHTSDNRLATDTFGKSSCLPSFKQNLLRLRLTSIMRRESRAWRFESWIGEDVTGSSAVKEQARPLEPAYNPGVRPGAYHMRKPSQLRTKPVLWNARQRSRPWAFRQEPSIEDVDHIRVEQQKRQNAELSAHTEYAGVNARQDMLGIELSRSNGGPSPGPGAAS